MSTLPETEVDPRCLFKFLLLSHLTKMKTEDERMAWKGDITGQEEDVIKMAKMFMGGQDVRFLVYKYSRLECFKKLSFMN